VTAALLPADSEKARKDRGAFWFSNSAGAKRWRRNADSKTIKSVVAPADANLVGSWTGGRQKTARPCGIPPERDHDLEQVTALYSNDRCDVLDWRNTRLQACPTSLKRHFPFSHFGARRQSFDAFLMQRSAILNLRYFSD